MTGLCEQLNGLNIPDIEYITNFKNILHDEEFLNDDYHPIKCYYCENEELKLFYREEFCTFSDEMKELIKGIMPFVKYHDIITVAYCEDCQSILAVKNYNDVKMYYSRFDDPRILEKYLIEKEYLNNDKKPTKCFHCDGTELMDNNVEVFCKKCGEKLGYQYNDKWYLV